MVSHQDDQERRIILDWLTLTGYGTQQSDFISQRQEGTGQWLLDSDEFQRWSKKSKQTLFCPGIPGAGKTMITAIVIDHLSTKFQKDASTGIAYIYCNYQPLQEQKPEDLLSSLLKQLAQAQPAVPTEIRDMYERYRIKGTRPSLNKIVRALHFTARLFFRVFVIIDTLDEYHISNNKGQQRLLSEVFSLRDQAQINLFATSRFVSEITSQFKGDISREIRAQDEDILSYVNGQISQLLRSRISKYPEYPDLKNTIRSEIVKAVNGMYTNPSVI
jgi:Cdc6-like AAA superfamily ATPase